MIDSYKNSGQCITLSINVKDVIYKRKRRRKH